MFLSPSSAFRSCAASMATAPPRECPVSRTLMFDGFVGLASRIFRMWSITRLQVTGSLIIPVLWCINIRQGPFRCLFLWACIKDFLCMVHNPLASHQSPR